MFRKFYPLIILLAALSCSPSKRNISESPKHFAASTPKPNDNGLSFETAIVINETSELKGVKAEYEWIANHYTNYKVKMQALNIHNNKPYDIITITQVNGEDVGLYFDISNYYGKF
jgi:hypothetical protein